MNKRKRGLLSAFPLFGATLAPNNGGKVDRVARERDPNSPPGGNAPTARSGSGEPAQPAKTKRSAVLAGEQARGGSRAPAPLTVPAPLPNAWRAKHAAALDAGIGAARLAAQRDGKPWRLHADQQTLAILRDCPERVISAATAAAYRKEYARLLANGRTAWEAARTSAHWQLLRTSCRYCMAADVRAFRRQSETARRAGNHDEAQRLTERAFALALALDEQFLQPHAPKWEAKARALKAAGTPPIKRSKRRSVAPAPDVAGLVLLMGKRRGTQVADRHAVRLIVLSLFGFRPTEMRKGIRVAVENTDAGQLITAHIRGAKVNDERGQDARLVGVEATGPAAQALAALVVERGGSFVLKTSAADLDSLNGALAVAGSGLSCYSFRHQFGSDLKAAVASGAMTAEEAAVAMGHRSTASLASYGSRRRGRGGRRIKAKGSEQHQVRQKPVSYAERADARAARKKAKAMAGVRSAPTLQTQTPRQKVAPPKPIVPRKPRGPGGR